MNIKELLGKKIRYLRQKKCISQSELAGMIGISQRSLSGIEIGKNFLTSQTLENILDCFHISVTELFDFEHFKEDKSMASELVDIITNLNDTDKLRTIYKVVKSIVKD